MLRQYPLNAQLKYINDGRQLLLAKATVWGWVNIVDIGWVIDNGPYQKYPYGNFQAMQPSNQSWYSGSCGLINNGVYVLTDTNPVKLTWYPIESFIHHKMTGTTRTISAYNNPFRIRNKKFMMQLTNDMSKIIPTDTDGSASSNNDS